MTVSVKAAAREAQREERKSGLVSSAKTLDSFVNLADKLGVGADNILSSGTYGFNPISRNRTILEWIHRGSWLGGLAVDVVADDMTRRGIEYVTELPPEQTEVLDQAATSLQIWHAINETIKWGRLYGGAICVMLIDGQDMRTPLRMETVGPGQFRGLLTLDRWQVQPTLEDLVTEFGPEIGLPRYYRVQANAPALRGMAIHHSRVVVRSIGVDLPYQQRLVENLWGISVLERLYDRMVAYDTASAGMAQLVGKSALRTLTVDGLRDVVAAGGKALEGLTSYVSMMRRYQGIEGVTMIDAKDKFEVQGHQAFSGIGDTLTRLGEQLSGALQIPLVRLFGQSPAGLNASGESDLRMYYDNIMQQQARVLYGGVTRTYRALAASSGITLPSGFSLAFRSLWEMDEGEKAQNGKSITDSVTAAYGEGLITQKVAMKELRQAARSTGLFSNISREDIEAADDQVAPPPGESVLSGLGALTGAGEPNEIRPNGEAGQVDAGPISRKPLQLGAPQRRPTNRGDQ